MHFSVENLGPLRNAEVDLSHDLIVLTGPNNTGKSHLTRSVFERVPQRCVLFPAERIAVGPLGMQSLSLNSAPTAGLADELERAVLGGALSVSEMGEVTFAPDTVPQRSLALSHAGSAVRSLASVVLYLRHSANPGDLMVIDEPELNLHPDNQRRITRILAKAVRRGIKIMMSTHSDYVLRELNHLVMLSKGGEATERLIDELGYDREALLTPDRLGVYLFRERTAHAIDVDETGFEVASIEREITSMNADAQRIYAGLFG